MEFFFRFSNLVWRWITQLYFRPQFGAIGKKTMIKKPILIRYPKWVFIGRGCSIREGARLELVMGLGRVPRLEIGDGTSIEQHVHISCGSSIKIGKRVSIAPRCTIVDITHPYEDVKDESSIASRIAPEFTPVEIGDGSFLGANSVILPGVVLGERCVVGANSVVTHSMLPFTVCVGNPARPIKRYNPSLQKWERL